MKKQLLSVLAAITVSSAVAQTPSPDWSISQNAGFPLPSAGTRYIDAIDANVMWVAGYHGTQAGRSYNWFSRTIDGGNTFNTGTVFADTITYVLSNMEAVDANTAWVCAFQHGGPGGYTPSNQGGGGIFKTTNGGTTWVNMTAQGMFTNTTASFANFVTFLTPLIGIANGDPVNGEYELWRTIDGGNTWTQIPGSNIPNPQASTEFALTNVYCKQGSSNVWFGTNEGRVFRSFDAGLTWNVSSLGTSAGVTNLAFITPSMGLVQANDGSVFNTTDGGASWNQITNIDPNMGFNEIKAIPGTNYYASADNQNQFLSYSNDNGVTWNNWGGSGISYLTVDFADASHAWAGSFSDATNAALGGIWKYTGAVMTPTNVVSPTAAFTVATNVCGPVATLVPANNSTGTGGTLTYTWTASPAGVVFSNSTAATPSISFSAVGSYTISLEAENLGGINVTSQVVNIVACSAPTASFTTPANAVCNSVAFSVTTTINQGTPAAGLIWTASPANGVTFLPSAAVANPSVKIQNPGTYTLTLVASNVAGSISTSNTVSIIDCNPVPVFSLQTGVSSSYAFTGSMCRKSSDFNDTLYTNNTTVGAGITYSWSIAPTTLVSMTSYNGAANRKVIFATTSSTTSVTYTITLKATNASGSNQVSQTVKVQNCYVGIGENTLAENMSVYPNPAHEQLTLSLPDAGKTYNVKIVNVLGSVVYENNIKNSTNVNINLADKANGIYFLTVEANGEKATKKIIVE